jgi:hypothetical protein
MAKAKKVTRKGKGVVLSGWWAWKDPNGELDLENLRPTRVRCEMRSNPWGDRKGKPVRVQITEAKGAKRGK